MYHGNKKWRWTYSLINIFWGTALLRKEENKSATQHFCQSSIWFRHIFSHLTTYSRNLTLVTLYICKCLRLFSGWFACFHRHILTKSITFEYICVNSIQNAEIIVFTDVPISYDHGILLWKNENVCSILHIKTKCKMNNVNNKPTGHLQNSVAEFISLHPMLLQFYFQPCLS